MYTFRITRLTKVMTIAKAENILILRVNNPLTGFDVIGTIKRHFKGDVINTDTAANVTMEENITM